MERYMSQFENLTSMGKKEKQPQRMLFLFAKTTNMLGKETKDYQSGTIDSVMCVDKSLKELTTFEALVHEADQQTTNWNIILATSLSGKNNVEPTIEEIDKALHNMSNVFINGADLSQFVIMNREEETVIIS